MPTERFYRLSEEKKRIIRSAAAKEFARVPIDKVSINQIIKEADISRGSFYTYFEDKWDLLSCILEENQKKLRDFCVKGLKESQGNIWIMLEGLFEGTLEFCSGKEQFEFIKNLMNHSSSEELMRGFTKKVSSSMCNHMNDATEQWIYENTDKKFLKVENYNEFHSFFQMAMFVIAMGVKDYFDMVPEPLLRERFSQKINMLKYGVCHPLEAVTEK